MNSLQHNTSQTTENLTDLELLELVKKDMENPIVARCFYLYLLNRKINPENLKKFNQKNFIFSL